MSDEIYLDPLTGLYNRRYLEEILIRAIEISIGQGDSFTLAMVDIDSFKTVNDLHGHERGDLVIKEFAHFIQDSTRISDKIIRYGGDEFLCFLPGLRRQNAETLFNRIIQKCHERKFSHIRLTTSIGVATFPDDGKDYKSLFARADASLYDAKRSGRDRVGIGSQKRIDIPTKAFIDRRYEFSTILRLISNGEDSIRIIVINGNIGVGKTRLARECFNSTESYEIIWTDCLLFNETIAYYAIREIIKYRLHRRGAGIFDNLPAAYRFEIGKLVPEILERNQDENQGFNTIVDRYRLYESIRKSFEVGKHPKITLIDNFQWIDKESLEVLKYLIRTLKETAHIFFFINRSEEVPDPVRKFLAEAERDVAVHTIDLAPLPYTEVKSWVCAVIGDKPEDKLVEYAFQSSGGNPYFLEELFRVLEADGHLILDDGQWKFRAPARAVLPKTIDLIAMQKYQQLSAEAQLVLQYSSIVGRFDIGILWRLTGYSESELQGHLTHIGNAGLIREFHGQLIFVDEFSRHAIYNKCVLESKSPKLHQRVAELLEFDYQGRETEVADDLASNYYHAGVIDKGLKYCLLAGYQAQSKYAHEDAIRYFTWAEKLLSGEPGADAQRYSILLAIEKAYDQQGNREAQQKTLDTLGVLANILNDDLRRAAVALRRANFAGITGSYPAATATAQEAIRLAQSTRNQNVEAAGFLAWGTILWRQGAYNDARTKLKKALSIAQLIGERELEGQSLRQLGFVDWCQGLYSGIREHYQQALVICREIGDRVGESEALNRIGLAALDQGELTDARSYFEQAVSICREVGARSTESVALNNLGEVFRKFGDYAGSQHYYEQALRICREIGQKLTECAALTNLSLLFHFMKDDETAQEYNQLAMRMALDIGASRWQGYAITNLGFILTSMGQHTKAIAHFEQATEVRRKLGQQNLSMESIAGLAMAHLKNGDLPKAQSYVDEILKHLQNGTLDGTDEPLQIYLTCCHVLQATQDPRQMIVLADAQRYLQEQAIRITDDMMRKSFLHNVACHSEILSLYDHFNC